MQLSIGLAGDMSLHSGLCDAERSAAGWLIRSNQPHWLSGAGTRVTIFWDPVSVAGRRAATRLSNDGVTPLEPEECACIRRELDSCWVRGWRHPDLRTAADRIAHIVERPVGTETPIDRRVQIVLKALQGDPAGKSTLAELAVLTRLSEGRLAHLFRRDVGIPMRQYRLALRMDEAVREMADGASLSKAAYAAGFADPAHFSRICRRMFGAPPSGLPVLQLET